MAATARLRPEERTALIAVYLAQPPSAAPMSLRLQLLSELLFQAGISEEVVNTWFLDARRRVWPIQLLQEPGATIVGAAQTMSSVLMYDRGITSCWKLSDTRLLRDAHENVVVPWLYKMIREHSLTVEEAWNRWMQLVWDRQSRGTAMPDTARDDDGYTQDREDQSSSWKPRKFWGAWASASDPY